MEIGEQLEYKEWRETTDLRDPYRIPMDFLKGTKPFIGPVLAEAPLICFINCKSGGRLGPRLGQTLSRAISGSQVFDVSQYRPDAVLSTIYSNLQRRMMKGDTAAAYIVTHLTILCCGGDGTVAWVLKTIQDLKLDPAPHVAVCPLGTGNDLALSFGWGHSFNSNWFKGHKHTYVTLASIAAAKRVDLDCWSVRLSVPRSGLLQRLPHSMEVTGQQANGQTEVRSLFWNYLSFGIDAEAAWGFSHLRERKPGLASRRPLNMGWYAWFSCTSGWFCPGHFALQDKIDVKAWARNEAGEMEEVRISHGISAVVLLNLQSYGGGRDLWGLKDLSPDPHTHKTFKPPIFNDGQFEVVGLRNGWHTALVMGKFSHHVHATRLAQTSEFLLEARSRGPAPRTTHMQLDGEPWPQAVPGSGEEPLRVHVSLHGKSNMLFNTEFPKGGTSARKTVVRGAGLSRVYDKPQVPERSFASVILYGRDWEQAVTASSQTVAAAGRGLDRTTSGPYAGAAQRPMDALHEGSNESNGSSCITPPVLTPAMLTPRD